MVQIRMPWYKQVSCLRRMKKVMISKNWYKIGRKNNIKISQMIRKIKWIKNS
jgi:hypothetical protein